MKLNKIIMLVFVLATLLGCKTHTIVQDRYVEVKDTVEVRDTVIQVQIEQEHVKEYVQIDDTLHLQTKYAHAIAYVKESTLQGEIHSTEQPIEVKVQYKDRLVTKTDYKTVTKVEQVKYTPTYVKWTLAILAGLVITLLGALNVRQLLRFL